MLSIPLEALVLSCPSRSTCCLEIGWSVISTPPIEISSSSSSAWIRILFPLTNTPFFESVSVMVQLPSSYRVSTAWFRDTVGKSIRMSLRLC